MRVLPLSSFMGTLLRPASASVPLGSSSPFETVSLISRVTRDHVLIASLPRSDFCVDIDVGRRLQRLKARS